MSRGSGSSFIPVAVFLIILLIILPVSADNVTVSETTVVPANTTITVTQTPVVTTNTTITVTQTSAPPTETTVATTPIANSTTQTTVATTQTTALPTTTTVTVTQTATVVATVNLTTGNVNVYSSPTGASILIDGIYSGTTPKNVNGVPGGNHILRLSLSGYNDYEGSIHVVPGQENQGYGTLQPLNQVTIPLTAVPTIVIPVVVPVKATPIPTQDTGLLGNSSVIAALLGAMAVLIAAGASVFTHIKPPKKE